VALLTEPGALLISEDLAREHGLTVGARIELIINGRSAQGRLVGLLQGADALSRRALDGLVLADIATAQELTGQGGRLDHIDLILPEDDGSAVQRIASLLPPNAQIVPAAARAGAVAQMTAAFRINLTALSLLALVVGMFLIYNSMTFSVVQRRPLFGTLRCQGVTREEIAGMVLVEALAVGLIGSALGLGLGIILGQAAVRLVTQTINDLYFAVTVRGVAVAPESLIKGGLIGMIATVASAALPAWEAASSPPRLALVRSGIEERARRAVPLTAAAAAISFALGAGLLAVPSRAFAVVAGPGRGPAANPPPAVSLTVSFAGIFFVTIAFALLAPAATLILMAGFRPIAGRLFGVLGRLAPRNVSAALSRTAVAVAALMVAVSVTIGVGLMIASFRATVVGWLGQTLWGDIYISAPGLTATRAAAPLDPQIAEIARHWPGVERADVLRSADVGSPAGRIAVSAVSDRDLTLPRMFAAARCWRANRWPIGWACPRTGQRSRSIPIGAHTPFPWRGSIATIPPAKES
ncbi:MAG: ABC transporter permease, partial [Anaerolineae bacterium]